MALFLVVMMCTQSFAFGQYQVRIATALYGLSAIFPFLIIPFGLVNVLANTLMGGLGPLDMLGGNSQFLRFSEIFHITMLLSCCDQERNYIKKDENQNFRPIHVKTVLL